MNSMDINNTIVSPLVNEVKNRVSYHDIPFGFSIIRLSLNPLAIATSFALGFSTCYLWFNRKKLKDMYEFIFV